MEFSNINAATKNSCLTCRYNNYGYCSLNENVIIEQMPDFLEKNEQGFWEIPANWLCLDDLHCRHWEYREIGIYENGFYR
jgi:hypothetical protein